MNICSISYKPNGFYDHFVDILMVNIYTYISKKQNNQKKKMI